MNLFAKWLPAFALAALLAPGPAAAGAEEASLSGSVEIGGAGVAVSDEKARVNEYSEIRPDPGATAYGKADIHLYDPRGIAIDARSRYMGNHDQDHGASLDLHRVLRNTFRYQSFEHQLDHDLIDYLDAAVPHPSSAAGNLGTLNPDNVPVWWDSQNDVGSNQNPALGRPGPTFQQIGRAAIYGEDLAPDADFGITYREWENKTEFVFPQLPNLTFDLTFRHEEREGLEQSIGMSKCTACHITGGTKEIDETTRDLTAGVTGKFGLLTLRYAFFDRDFSEGAADPSRVWDPALSPGAGYTETNATFDNRMLYDYENGALPYDVTPDSEKQSHIVKAKVDLPRQSSLLGSYVRTEIESRKNTDPTFSLNDNSLRTDYDIYGLRFATKLGKRLKLSVRARYEELENDAVVITYNPLGTSNASLTANGGVFDPASLVRSRESIIDREVATAGADLVYRLARRSTLRLGYEYKEEDRTEEHIGKTETDTYTVNLSARPSRRVALRVGYQYKDIENPFHNPDAALYNDPVTGLPITTVPGGFTIGNGPTYGTDFYDLRTADLSNQPDKVHEGKVSATWSPSAGFSATVNYRYKDEENDLNKSTWEQETHSPGLSLWYAPSGRFNLTLAYNYFDQRSETAFCQGFYDG